MVACSSDDDDTKGNENGNGNSSGSVYRPKFVDLGLPSGVLWADCNLGAKTPYEAGNYYAYGEIETKSDYSWSTYKFWKNKKITKYTGEDGKKNLDAADDVARVYLGEKCRIPTYDDYMELKRNCSWSWISEYHGANGFLFKGPNGNTIFLPAAGIKAFNYRYGYGANAGYWLSEVSSNNGDYTMAFGMMSTGSMLDTRAGTSSRVAGMNVRPVAVK